MYISIKSEKMEQLLQVIEASKRSYIYFISVLLKYILLFAVLSVPKIGMAAHLGMIPIVDNNNLRLMIEGRSDIWTSPYRDKEIPLRIHELKLRVPLINTESWSASAHIGAESLSSGRADVTVGRNPVFIGSDLRSLSAGFAVKRTTSEGSSVSIFTAQNSSSDEVYRDTRDTWTEVSIFYEFAPQDRLQWVVAANSSKNRGFLNNQIVPFVGVYYKPGPNFSVTFGFPFARLIWSSENFWTTSLYLTPVGVHGEVTRSSSSNMSWRVKAGLSSRSYLHVNRIDDHMRLIFVEKYFEGGFKSKVSDQTFVGFMIGASFDRVFYEAKSVFSAEGQNTGLNKDLYGTFLMEFEL